MLKLLRVVILLPVIWQASLSLAADADETEINALLDGLHRDAAEAQFDAYFARYTPDAVFLGTDKTERWSLDAFKAYSRPHFEAGRGWVYQPVSRHIMGGGDIRWFDEVLRSEKYGHCRGTGVVIRSSAGWRIAHYSLSFLIPNAVAAEATALGVAAEASEAVQP